MIDQINELPEDGLKFSPKTLRYIENKWISQKNSNKLYFLHLIIVNGELKLCFFLCYIELFNKITLPIIKIDYAKLFRKTFCNQYFVLS